MLVQIRWSYYKPFTMLLVKARSQEGTYLVYTGKTNVKLSHPRKSLHAYTPPLPAEEQK